MELKVKARATVSSGLEETLPLWQAVLPPPSGAANLPMSGNSCPDLAADRGVAPWPLDAVLDVVLARSMAADGHLMRNVAICSTTEL